MYRIILPLAVLALLAFAAGHPGAVAADDQELVGDLQPLVPLSQVRIFNFQNNGMNNAFALSPEGKTLAMPNYNGFALFDLTKSSNAYQQQQQRFVTLEHQMNLYNSPLAFGADGKTVVAVPLNQEDAAVRFVDLSTGKEIRQIDNDQQFFGLAFSPDGKLLALSTQGRVEVWDAGSGDEIRLLQADPNSNWSVLAFAPDGKMLATAGMGQLVHLWELASGKERQEFRVSAEVPAPIPGHYYPGGNNPVSALAISPDGKLLAVGAADNAIYLWNLLTGQELPPLVGHEAAVRALVFTPDGKRLVSFDGAGLKLVWSVRRLEKTPPDKWPALRESELEELWNDLAEADAFRTYRVFRYFLADRQRVLPLLRQHLQPVPSGDSQLIAKLVADLQNPNGGVRRKAMAGLRKQGEAALGALYQLPDNQKQGMPAIRTMIHKLETRYSSPDRVRSLKAVQLLEQIGGDEARQLLEKLAKGAPGAKLTVAAKFALERKKEAGSRDATARTPNGVGRIPKDGLTSKELEALWNDLASADAPKAFQAIKMLRAVPGQSVPLLQGRSQPEKPVDAEEITRLITELDNNQFATREKATRELESLEELASPALRQTLGNRPSLEVRRRIETLLEKVDRHTPSSKHLRALRTIEILEGIGTTEAREALTTLGKGAPQARLTQLATAAQERLAKRSVTAR